MSNRFLDAIHSGRVLLMDGAMGTELQRRGIAPEEGYELCNVERPKVVREIHDSYVQAGARVLLTNSFQANPAALRKRGLDRRLCELNEAAVRLACAAVGTEGYVLGAIGPWPDAKATEFAAVLDSLQNADAFLFETRSERRSFADAKRAKGHHAKTPVLISLAFRKTGSGCEILTYDDLKPEACAAMAEEAGCDALGVNCGNRISLGDVTQIARRFRSATSLPLFVRPNAGTPARTSEGYSYPVTPQQIADWLPEVLDAGIAMVGGCCGTTPEHIAAMRATVDMWNQKLRAGN